MHNMLIVALMVFGFVMINPFVYGSDNAKVAASTQQSAADTDDQDSDDSDEGDEDSEEEDETETN